MKSNFVVTYAALLCGTIAGCGDGVPPPPPDDAPAILVVYRSGPVVDVQVQLHESPSGPIIAQAITSADGKARFAQLPDPQPREYCVTLESVGDGSWILDPRIMQRFTQTLRIKPLTQNSSQSIELPARSIQSLHR